MQDVDKDTSAEKKPKKGFFDKVASAAVAGYNIAKGVGSAIVGGSAPAAPYQSELAAKMREYMEFAESVLETSDIHAELYERLKVLLTESLTVQHVADDINQTCVCIQQHVERVSCTFNAFLVIEQCIVYLTVLAGFG